MNSKELAEKLRVKSNDIINDLSKEEIEQYILFLTKNYYDYYLSGNANKFNDNFKELKNLIGIVESGYPNIRNYINYCLLCNINKILEDSLKMDMDLIVFEDSIDKKEGSKIDMLDERIFEYDLKLMKAILEDKK